MTDYPAADPRQARRQAALLHKAMQFLSPLERLSFEMAPTELGLRYESKLVLNKGPSAKSP
jgi:hypothetical protein